MLLKRLLGAGVVIALAVIVLPFILQGSGYKASLNTDIPTRPQPLQPLDTAIPEPAADVREQLLPPVPLPVPAARNNTVVEPPAPAAPQSSPKEIKLAESQTPAKPVAKAESKPAPAKPDPVISKPAPEASTAPTPTAKTETSPKPMAMGQWFIQLGSFSAENNAQTLRSQVQRAGVPCLIEPLSIEGRKVWRVRAGPFKTQTEAEAALKRLQGGLKLGGMVMQVR